MPGEGDALLFAAAQEALDGRRPAFQLLHEFGQGYRSPAIGEKGVELLDSVEFINAIYLRRKVGCQRC